MSPKIGLLELKNIAKKLASGRDESTEIQFIQTLNAISVGFSFQALLIIFTMFIWIHIIHRQIRRQWMTLKPTFLACVTSPNWCAFFVQSSNFLMNYWLRGYVSSNMSQVKRSTPYFWFWTSMNCKISRKLFDWCVFVLWLILKKKNYFPFQIQ